jgi:3-polyprenyl-4-hydroxybenzoate decarboxylase
MIDSLCDLVAALEAKGQLLRIKREVDGKFEPAQAHARDRDDQSSRIV